MVARRTLKIVAFSHFYFLNGSAACVLFLGIAKAAMNDEWPLVGIPP